MATSEEMHWHEGLFMQPHHLQMMQRHIGDRFADERALAWSYPYGVIELKLSADALESGRVRFDRLRAVMPSGLLVDMPNNADVPALDIEEMFTQSTAPFTLYLGVPLWYATRGNVIEDSEGQDWRVKRLYRVVEQERADENTGDNRQPVRVRRLNPRLLFEHDDRSDMEAMPLLRVYHAPAEEIDVPHLDPEFAPPCLVLRGSRELYQLVRDLSSQIEASRKDLVRQMGQSAIDTESMRGLQVGQMLRLRTLNRFSARLPHLVRAPGCTPFQMYLALRELLGELAALEPDRDPFDAPDYDHDHPLIAFQDICFNIRVMVRAAGLRFLSVPFVKEANRLVARLEENHFSQPNAYYLAVRSREDPSTVAQLVTDANKFKLMPMSMADRAVFGVTLIEEHFVPFELPAEAGLYYFRLNLARSGDRWTQAREDGGLALTWPNMELSDFEVTLYMTVPILGEE